MDGSETISMKRMARFQQTLASQASCEKFGRKGKRELFLDQMNQVVPWSELLSLVEQVLEPPWPLENGTLALICAVRLPKLS